MNDTRITFNTSALAKDKGFDLEVNGFYNQHTVLIEHGKHGNTSFKDWNNYNEPIGKAGKCYNSAPTQSELQTWLRKTPGIKLWCAPHPFSSSGGWAYSLLAYKEGVVTVWKGEQASSVHLTYEQALEEGLQEALKHI